MSNISISDVNKYGGKGAMLLALQECGARLPIPEFRIKSPGEEVPDIPFNGPYMVRSSSPLEDGIACLKQDKEPVSFAGLFHSEDASDVGDIEYLVDYIERHTRSPVIKRYAEKHDVKLTADMAVIIQKHSKSKINGSITRHPNDEDLLIINFTDVKDRDSDRLTYETYYHEKKDIFSVTDVAYPRAWSRVSEDRLREVVKTYKLIEEQSFISPTHTYQVEFGLEPFVILQARPFRKKETADFEVPDIDEKKVHGFALPIGITDEEGITLPVLRSFDVLRAEYYASMIIKETHPAFIGGSDFTDVFMNKLTYMQLKFQEIRIKDIQEMMRSTYHRKDKKADEPYCFAIDKINKSGQSDVELTKMKAFVDFDSFGIMTHDGFRLLQDSDVSLLFHPFGVVSDIPLFGINNCSLVRIISNGRDGVLIEEEHDIYEKVRKDWVTIEYK